VKKNHKQKQKSPQQEKSHPLFRRKLVLRQGNNGKGGNKELPFWENPGRRDPQGRANANLQKLKKLEKKEGRHRTTNMQVWPFRSGAP